MDTLFDYLATIDTNTSNREALEKQAYEQFGKNLAVVCMDSTGFSRTVKKRGIVYYLSLIAKMRGIVATSAETHNVCSYRSYADNFFAEFSSVTDALNAVLTACREIRAAELMLSDDEAYEICIGIGYGHVLFSESDGPFGDQMNLASKLGEDTAEGEEILLTPEALAQLPIELHSAFEKREFSISGLQEEYFRTTFDILQKFKSLM